MLLVAISLAMALVIISATQALIEANAILHNSCNLPEAICPYAGFPLQSIFAFVIDAGILTLGVFLIYSSGKGGQSAFEIPADLAKIAGSLDGDEKKLYDIMISEGAVFQSELVEKSGFAKAKVTRILDKLEGKGLLERRRRGLTNMVIPKKSKNE